MKRLMIASIVLAMAVPAFAQSTRTQPQTRTTDPDSTITESQKGGPASKELCRALEVSKLSRNRPRQTPERRAHLRLRAEPSSPPAQGREGLNV